MADVRYTLDDFIADLDRITRQEDDATRIAEQAAPLLARLVKDPACIPERYRRGGAGGRRGRYMLYRAPRFNVTSVVWRPGDVAGAHNHETWGVIGVIDNQIQETRYRMVEDGGAARPSALQVTSVTHHGPGAVSCLVPGDEIHAMENVTGRDTVEIHVYGKDLAGLKRRTWDAKGNEKPLISPKYMNC